MHTGIFNPIDAQQDGKTVTHLSLPYSIDRSPYYQIKIPICHIRNGVGPRVLLTAGNHGDEYEGELTLLKLIQKLEPADIRGTVTILPAVNMPAVMEARRRSPFDDGNLNRAFPGDPKGTPTERIAHFIGVRREFCLRLGTGLASDTVIQRGSRIAGRRTCLAGRTVSF